MFVFPSIAAQFAGMPHVQNNAQMGYQQSLAMQQYQLQAQYQMLQYGMMQHPGQMMPMMMMPRGYHEYGAAAPHHRDDAGAEYR